MKRKSYAAFEQLHFNRLNINYNNIDNYKMLTQELDPEIIQLIKVKNNEKKELNQAADLVRDYVSELKEEMKSKINIKDNKLNEFSFSPTIKKNIKENSRYKINENYSQNNNSIKKKRYSEFQSKSQLELPKYFSQSKPRFSHYLDRSILKITENLSKSKQRFSEYLDQSKFSDFYIKSKPRSSAYLDHSKGGFSESKPRSSAYLDHSKGGFSEYLVHSQFSFQDNLKKTNSDNLMKIEKKINYLDRNIKKKSSLRNFNRKRISMYKDKFYIKKFNSLKTAENYNKSFVFEDNSLNLSSSVKIDNNTENSLIKKSKKVQDLIINNKNNIHSKTNSPMEIKRDTSIKYFNTSIKNNYQKQFSIKSSSPSPFNNIKRLYRQKTSHSKNDSENDSWINKTVLSNKTILMLNDIKKELKHSFIGEKFVNVKKKKVFFLDDITNFPLEPINSIKEETDNDQIETRYRNLQKKGYVYDSFDDEENFDEEINLFYINPDSKYILFFDLLIALCSVFNIIYIPLFLGYNIIYCSSYFFNVQNIIELFTDIVYIIDLILPFFTAFYNFDENLNTGLNHIAKKYLSEWFILDLLQAIPFKTILVIFDKKCKNPSFQLHPNYNNNFYYILCTFRLFKIIKVVKNNKFIEKITNILNETNHYNHYLKIYKNLFIFIICIHTVSNIFIFIGRNEYPNWIIYYGYDSYSYLKLYLTAIYYTIETLTTVGYGDLTCITPKEKLFGLFMEIVGIFAYSWAISHISNYFKVINEKNENYERNFQILNQIKLLNPKFPIDLYDRILRYLKYKHDNEKVDKQILFDSLSPNLSNLLCYEMYKPIIQNFIFFKHFDNIDFIVKVVLNFNPILAVKNDILIKDGELVEDIIFVKKGKLSLELPLEFNPKFNQNNTSIKNSIMPHCPKTFGETIISQNKQDYFQMFSRTKSKLNIKKSLPKKNEDIQVYKILEIRKNEHFGDILMFLNLRSPLILRTKTQKAELFLLHKTAAIEISTSYPLIWKKINQKSLFNYEQIRRLMNK